MLHLNEYEAHNKKEKDSAEFVGTMLNVIREKELMYSDWVLNEEKCNYHSKSYPSQVFVKLCHLSDYIQDQCADSENSYKNKSYFNFMRAYSYAIEDQSILSSNVLNVNIRRGLSEIIWRISDCLRFVKGKQNEELDEFVKIIRYSPGLDMNWPIAERYQLQASTENISWASIIEHWKLMKRSWERYLELFDSVFNKIFINIDETMISLIQRYPSVFWFQFWKSLGDAKFHGEVFPQYLINEVGPLLLDNQPVQHYKNYQAALRHFITLLDNSSDAKDFANKMSNPLISDGLLMTNTVLYPHSEMLGEDTLRGMRHSATG